MQSLIKLVRLTIRYLIALLPRPHLIRLVAAGNLYFVAKSRALSLMDIKCNITSYVLVSLMEQNYKPRHNIILYYVIFLYPYLN